MNQTAVPFSKKFSFGISICLFLLSSLVSTAQTNYTVNYDGANDYISIPSSVAVSQLNTFTVEAWVYWNGTGNGCIYSETIQGNNNPMFSIIPRSVDGGGIELTFRDNSAVGLILQPATATITANRWVHVAVVRTSATTMKVYIDGELKDDVTFTAPASWTPDKVNIGLRWRAAQTDPFAGKIDELRIWNTARTQAEIKANMFNRNLSNSASGLVAYYRFNEGSLTTAANSCTNTAGIDGTLTNGPTWVSSPIEFGANALNFDGSDDFVNIPHVVSSDFTVEYWMKTSSTGPGNNSSQWYGGSGIVDAEVGGVTTDWGTSLTGQYLAFGVGNPDVTIHSSSIVNTGNWIHVAATWKQSTGQMILYINGIQEDANTGSTVTRSAPGRITFGEIQTNGNRFNGTIDEVRIWNVVRTQSEIQAGMNYELDPASGSTANLVAYYSFNQNIAGGTNTGMLTLIDQKNNNNGTLNNFALSGASSNFVSQNGGIFVLPVEWLSFTAQAQDNQALLQWSTASEQNTKNFIIQHSSNGVSWNNIGQVAAAGNSSSVNNYSYVDASPNTGINYYRIQQKDIDGRFSYSKVVTIRLDASPQVFTILSNPVSNGMLQLNMQRAVVISIYNTNGSLLIKQKLAEGKTTIDLTAYPKGVYWLQTGGSVQKVLLP